MTAQEVREMIDESIKKLEAYETKVLSRINNLLYCKSDIQEGRRLLFDILRGRLFEDENGKDPEYESLVGEDAFNRLRKEIKRTANLVSLLIGDIFPEGYKRKMVNAP